MLTFCPSCGLLLEIEEGRTNMQLSCPTCPYVAPITQKVGSKIYPKMKELGDILSDTQAWENAQSTEERCPKCSHERAYFMQLQTRSADEPMTIFYRCANHQCKHRWKE
ncbi:unnamed protein product, partial [Mesorhabditis belari]|uniref:DNA-directed RNA polymerase subunit n=1 Tax=Mesorhabditis belari TaxID=2138241 RepID=A0AAF3EG30_9BILA